MAPGANSYLWKLTYDWWLADSKEEKKTIESQANNFRKSGYTDTGDEKWNNIIKKMDARPSNFKINEDEHFFRNELNIEYSYGDFWKIQMRLPEEYKWSKVIADYHQNHTYNGKPNIKYVSSTGSFEIVFNANRELQTSSNNPDDMGTYNYYEPRGTTIIEHGIYDVVPYKKYGNIKR